MYIPDTGSAFSCFASCVFCCDGCDFLVLGFVVSGLRWLTCRLLHKNAAEFSHHYSFFSSNVRAELLPRKQNAYKSLQYRATQHFSQNKLGNIDYDVKKEASFRELRRLVEYTKLKSTTILHALHSSREIHKLQIRASLCRKTVNIENDAKADNRAAF